MIKKQNKLSQRGFGLIDLMISVSIGSVLMAGVTTLYVDSLKNSSVNITSIRVEQDLQAIVQLISSEMRRAGYDGDSASGGDTDFGIEEMASTCIRYSYDSGDTPDGAVSANEKFGFRLNNNAVQFGSSVSNCTSGNWENINNPDLVKVSSLNLNVIELCVNLADNSNCNVADVGNDENPYVTPAVGDVMIKKYRLDLSISGYSANDDSMTKSIEADIRIFNDLRKTKS